MKKYCKICKTLLHYNRKGEYCKEHLPKKYCIDCGAIISKYGVKCKSCSVKGRKASEETKKKMSKNNSRYFLGKSSPRKGVKLSDEIKKKISNKLKGKPCPDETKKKLAIKFSGKGNPMYGRIGKSAPRYVDGHCFLDSVWRNSIKKRDGYICQICGRTNCWLDSHHIKDRINYPEFKYDVDNGITLCRSCHMLVHSNKIAL